MFILAALRWYPVLNSAEICIHGSPESLREFAKKLWILAEKSESQGKSNEQFTTSTNSEPELSNKLKSEADMFSIIKKLTVFGWGK